ncbi:MAG: hypothetical protein R3E95_10300 [Thiolinea sp.]
MTKEEYNLREAVKGLEISREHVDIQAVNLRNVSDSMRTTKLQQERIEKQKNTYADWIKDGLNKYERGPVKKSRRLEK